MRATRRVVVRACAKINLDLRILGRRSDGHHEVHTVLQTVDLHDTLTFIGATRSFTITGCPPGDRSNLIWRAAEGLAAETQLPPSQFCARVLVEKRIPIGTGLGGGSSDAAATLRALEQLWGISISHATRTKLATKLGADVPFFLVGGTALGVGRGDAIYSLSDLPTHWAVVVVPSFAVSTAEAYLWYDADIEAAPADGKSNSGKDKNGGGWPRSLTMTCNDLEAPVVRRHPQLEQIRLALQGGGALIARMSGSGSAVFGLFDAREKASRIRARLLKQGWTALLTRTISRAEYSAVSRPTRQAHRTWRSTGKR